MDSMLREMLQATGVTLPSDPRHTTATHSLRGGAAAEYRAAGVPTEIRDYVAWWAPTVRRTGATYEGVLTAELLAATDEYGLTILWWEAHGNVSKLGPWTDAWGLADLPQPEGGDAMDGGSDSDVDSEESVGNGADALAMCSLVCASCHAYMPLSAPVARCDQPNCPYAVCIACHNDPAAPLWCSQHREAGQ
jgi:hypothetical protein